MPQSNISLLDAYKVFRSFLYLLRDMSPPIGTVDLLLLPKVAKEMSVLDRNTDGSADKTCIEDPSFVVTLLQFCRAALSLYGQDWILQDLGYKQGRIPICTDIVRTSRIGRSFLLGVLQEASTQVKSKTGFKGSSRPETHTWVKQDTVSDLVAGSDPVIHAIEDPHVQAGELVQNEEGTKAIRYDIDGGRDSVCGHAAQLVSSEHVRSAPHTVDRLRSAFAVIGGGHRSMDTIDTLLQTKVITDMHAFALEMGLTAEQILVFSTDNGLFETPYCLYVDARRREIVIAIRGTYSLTDIKVDLMLGYVQVTRPPLCPKKDGKGYTGVTKKMSKWAHRKAKKETLKIYTDQMINPRNLSMESTLYAHQGIYITSSKLYHSLRPHIEQLYSVVSSQETLNLLTSTNITVQTACDKSQPYKFVFTGHSLGGGVASLLAYFFEPVLGERVRAYGFGTPPTVSRTLQERMEPYSYQVVLEHDIVPRLSLGPVQAMMWRLSMRAEIRRRGLVDALSEVLQVKDRSSSDVSQNQDQCTQVITTSLTSYSNDALLTHYAATNIQIPSSNAVLSLHVPGRILLLGLARNPLPNIQIDTIHDILKLSRTAHNVNLCGSRFAFLYRADEKSICEARFTNSMCMDHLSYFEYLLLVLMSLQKV